MSRLPMRARRAAVGAVLLILALSTGCGGQPTSAAVAQSGDVTVSAGADGVQAITIEADNDFRFVPATFRVSPGRVRVTVQNTSGAVHSLRFDPGGPAEELPLVRAGQSDSIEFTVSTPGAYAFVCTFHIALNQRGVMIVQ